MTALNQIIRILRRAKRFAFGPRSPVHPQIYVSVLADCGHCVEDCRSEQRAWQEWLQSQFDSYRSVRTRALKLSETDQAQLEADRTRFGGRLATTELPLAILTLDDGYEAYFANLGPKGRNMVRKTEKLGYSFERFDWNERLEDIFAINTSMDERGGVSMSASYRAKPSPVSIAQYCEQRGRLCYGAFKDGTMVGYIVLVTFRHFAAINTILGHGEHLKAGIMNGLVDFMVRDLCTQGRVRFVNYLTLTGGRETLDGFKRRVGFEERQAIFLARPSR